MSDHRGPSNGIQSARTWRLPAGTCGRLDKELLMGNLVGEPFISIGNGAPFL